MKRDMDLCRKILFQIEEEYVSTAIINLKIEGYTDEEVAYHCNILSEAGMISDYKAQYADGQIWVYTVGHLTWEGHDFLDKIREDTVWHRTKDVIFNQGLPMALDVVKQVATALITSMTEGAVRAALSQG